MTEGLRARKQRETREAIHRAAVELALEHGLEGATVAAISDRVNISVRTFFNYYPAKDDAIVGLHEGLPSDEELDELRAGGADDLIDDLTGVLLGVFTPGDDQIVARRRQLIRENPQLIQRQWARMHGVEQRTAAAVADRMRTSGAFGHLDIGPASTALVAACSGLVRSSVREAVDAGDYPAGVTRRVDDGLRALRDILGMLS